MFVVGRRKSLGGAAMSSRSLQGLNVYFECLKVLNLMSFPSRVGYIYIQMRAQYRVPIGCSNYDRCSLVGVCNGLRATE